MSLYKYLRRYMNKKSIAKHVTLSNLALSIGTVLLAHAFLFSATPPSTTNSSDVDSTRVLKFVLEESGEIYSLVDLPSTASSKIIENFYPNSEGLKALGLKKESEQNYEYVLRFLAEDLPIPLKSLSVNGETIVYETKNTVRYNFNGVISVVLLGGKRVSARDISAEVIVTYNNDYGTRFLFIQGTAKSQILENISRPAKKILTVVIKSIFENQLKGLIQGSTLS